MVALMVLLAGPVSVAQPPGGPPGAPVAARTNWPQPLEALEGRAIAEVVLRQPVAGAPGAFEPLSAAVERLARNQIRSAEGTPLVPRTVEQDVSRLNRIGRFRMIRAEGEPLSDGSVRLVYTLAEQPVIQDVQVVGNRLLSDQEILSSVAVISGTPVDRFQIDRGARGIEDLYRARGYYAARVEIDERALEESAIVLYRVLEGEPIKVTVVRFEGNTRFTARELRRQIKTTTSIPIIEKAPLDDTVLNDDVVALARFYRDRGHLDARTGVTVQPSPNGREAIVTFQVEEGPLYTLRSIQVFYVRSDDVMRYRREVLGDATAGVSYLTPEQMRQIGRRAFTDGQVSGLMEIKPGDAYSEDKMRRSMDAIREAYGKLGYLVDLGGPRGQTTVRIESQQVRDERRPEIDLLLFIGEGRPYKTGEIIVTGNELTKQQVILRQVQVRPERPLDRTALDDTQRRIDQLNLFKPGSVRVAVQSPQDARPEHRDVLIEVAETNTGSINIGAAVGSDAGVVGLLSLTQRNFDIADPPESFGELLTGRAFRGAGQTAEVRVEPGDRMQTYSVSLTEPYLLESNYQASGTAFFRTREFREYDEQRYGGRVSLGRRFGTVWTGNLVLRNDWVDLSNIDDDAPADYFEAEDLNRISGVGVVLKRTTTDSRTRPSRGSSTNFGIEQVGALGGAYDFTKLEFAHSAFFSVYESFLGYKTVLKLDNRMSYIPQGQDAAPVYERYYLGGQSFRGFGYRAVSPLGVRRDGTRTDDPVGGSWLFFLGAEINQPLYEDILSVVGFVDTGTVEENFGFSKYRVSVGVGVRLYIQQVSPVPLAFDFGFPIIKEDDDRERIFTFSIDVPY